MTKSKKSRSGLRGGAGAAKRVLQLYSVGTPVEVIAKRLNMSPPVVIRTLKKNGLYGGLYGDVLGKDERIDMSEKKDAYERAIDAMVYEEALRA